MGMTAWITHLLIFLSFVHVQTAPLVPEIHVRLVDVRDGRGYANQKIELQFHTPGTPQLQILESTSGTDGVAVFHLPQPVPQNIAAQVSGGGLYACYRAFPIDPQAVMREGLVSRCTKPPQGCACKFGKAVDGIQVQPGELVLPARRFTTWEKIAGHLWE